MKRTSSRASCDTSLYAASRRKSSSGPDDWLPKLSFEIPIPSKHPARQIAAERPSLLRSQSDQSALLPSNPSLSHRPSQSTTNRRSDPSYPTHRRNQTIATTISSDYSQSTCDSTFSHERPGNDSVSSNSSHGSPDKPDDSQDINRPHRDSKPDVPKIPEQYRQPPMHSLRNGGKPMRPRSRPPMPPAKFWEYARQEQQRYNDFMQDCPPPPTPIARPRRHTEAPKPLKPSPPKPSVNDSTEVLDLAGREAAGQLHRKMSYENLRKGESMPVMLHPWVSRTDLSEIFDDLLLSCAPEEDRGRCTERRDARTLVKKRQPWDREPRQVVDMDHT